MPANTCDVIVIGGGNVGCSTAYFLNKKGYKVTLLEREALGYGASGRNFGFLWLHLRPAGVELNLARAGAALYQDFVDDFGNDFEYRRNGGMVYGFNEAHARVLREFAAARRKDGLAFEILEGPAVQERFPVLPQNANIATYCPEDGQINAPLFVRAIGQASRRQGVDVREGISAYKILIEKGKVTGVETSEGVIRADRVVLACGSWSEELARGLGLTIGIHPVRVGVMSTKPMDPIVDIVANGPAAIKHYQIIKNLPSFNADDFTYDLERVFPDVMFLDCVSQRRDGSYILGYTVENAGMSQDLSLASMALTSSIIAATIPKLAGAKMDKIWGGLIPTTNDALPVIDEVPNYKGLIVAAGHTWGNAAGPITGKLVAEMIAGATPSQDMTPFKFGRESLRKTKATWS